MKEKEIFKKCATLHEKEISTGFISSLGTPFLSTLYTAISKSPFSTVLYSELPGSSGGFVAGAVSTRKMYRWILMRFGVVFFVRLAIKAFDPAVLKKILETAMYSFQKKNNNEPAPGDSIEAELLAIAVDRSNRGKGTGKKLIGDLENWYRGMGVTSYKTVTWSKDPVSNKFYLSCGFTLSNSFTHHNNLMNVYIKNLV